MSEQRRHCASPAAILRERDPVGEGALGSSRSQPPWWNSHNISTSARTSSALAICVSVVGGADGARGSGRRTARSSGCQGLRVLRVRRRKDRASVRTLRTLSTLRT